MAVAVDVFHLCDHAFLDERHSLCLIGVHTELNASKFPYVRAVVTCAISMHHEPNEVANLVIDVSHANGEVMRSVSIRNNGSETGRSFVAIQMLQLTFRQEGEYVARVRHDGSVLAETRLRLKQVDSSRRPSNQTAGVDAPTDSSTTSG